ncbi:uncharacterized protein JCM15063_004972 [Sporobolomyces koalae]|uniref:uncharacterized protein n=1 Tax=Sporobolomyces koalae TaxID=500713 RepID=UPI00316CA58D
MTTSPFKRRPTVGRTYGKRSSLPSTSRRTPASEQTDSRSAVSKLLLDSSDDDASGNSEEDVVAALMARNPKGPKQPHPRTIAGDVQGDSGARNGSSRKNTTLEDPSETNRPLTRRRSSRKGVVAKSAEEDTTLWDETTAMAAASNKSTSRNAIRDTASTRTSARRESSPLSSLDEASPSKRPRLARTASRSLTSSDAQISTDTTVSRTASIESAPTSPPGRKRLRKSSVSATRSAKNTAQPSAEDMHEQGVPAPLDHVPPVASRRSSPRKARESVPRVADSSVPPANDAFAPIIRTTLPSSSSPAKSQNQLSAQSKSPVPASSRPIRSTPGSAQRKPPPSPAKDLSLLFSSFSKPGNDLSGDESSSSSYRGGLKRASSGGIVAGLAAKRTGDRSGSVTPKMPGSPGMSFMAENVCVEHSDRSLLATASPVRPARTPLDRSASQPLLSSPLSPAKSLVSPNVSPRRPAFSSTHSLPMLMSPTKSRSGSASPSKLSPFARGDSPTYEPPAIGSVYRPVSFTDSGLGASAHIDTGRTRTYGGARSFRQERDDDHPSQSHKTDEASTLDVSESATSLPQRSTLSMSLLTGRVRPAAKPRETYSQLREKWGVAAEEELDEDEQHESQERGARVIGTGILRAQGEGKRWSDEMGWTLEGLGEGKGGSAARSSAIELLGKILDREWMRRLNSSGMAERVYLAFRRGGAGSGDRVLDLALVVLLTALSKDQRLCEPVFRLSTSDIQQPTILNSKKTSTAGSPSPTKLEAERDCEVLGTLVRLANLPWAQDEIGGRAEASDKRAAKTSKSDTRHVCTGNPGSQQLEALMKERVAATIPARDHRHVQVTLRTLVLEILRSVATFAPRPIFQPQQLLCSSGAFETVVRIFLDECAPLGGRIDKYISGLDLVPIQPDSRSRDNMCPATISLCLAIFEATSLSTPHAFQIISSPVYHDALANAFRDVTLASSILTFSNSNARQQETSSRLLLSTLGILFGLSTEPTWSEKWIADHESAEDGIVGVVVRTALQCRKASMVRHRKKKPSDGQQDEPYQDDTPEWDAVYLLLGFLTNLLESADEAKDILRETLIDPNCQQSRKCTRKCTCPDPQPVLTILARLYLDPLEDAPNPVVRTSVEGFLKLLLGLSVVDNPRNESLVFDIVSNTSHPAMIAILNALNEFAKLHEDHTRAQGMLRLTRGLDRLESSTDEDQDIPGLQFDAEVVQRDRSDGDDAKRIRTTIARLKRRLD